MAILDPTRTKTIRLQYERALVRLWDRFNVEVMPLIRDILLYEDNPYRSIELVVDSALFNHVERPAPEIIRKNIRLSYRRGLRMAEGQISRLQTAFTLHDEEAVAMLQQNNLVLVKGVSADVKKSMMNTLTEGLSNGWSVDKIAREMRLNPRTMGKNRARLIARTEVIRACNTAASNRYQREGVEYFQWIAAADERSCPECTRLDYEVFKFGEHEIPPLHPQCRCSIAPYMGGPVEREVPDSIDDVETIEDAERYMRQMYPDTKWDFRGGHIDTIKPTMQEYAVLRKKYPGVAKRLEYVGTYKNGGINVVGKPATSYGFRAGTYAHASQDGKRIGLNTAYYGNPAKFKKSLEASLATRWHTCNPTFESVFCHEYGHMVDNYIRMSENAFGNYVSPTGFGLHNNLLSKFKSYPWGRAAISRYADTSADEAFAESFAYIRHGVGKIDDIKYVSAQDKFLKFINKNTVTKGNWQWANDLEGAELDKYLVWRTKMEKQIYEEIGLTIKSGW